MSAETRPTTARDEPPEVTRTAQISGITELVSKNNRHYHKVAFADGNSVTVFDPEVARRLRADMDVQYTVRRNDKTGYWDLKEISEVKLSEATNDDTTASPDKIPSDRGRERFFDDRERSIRSLNALTNATTLLAAMIQKDIVRPANSNEACAMVGDLHQRFLKMYDPQPHEERT